MGMRGLPTGDALMILRIPTDLSFSGAESTPSATFRKHLNVIAITSLHPANQGRGIAMKQRARFVIYAVTADNLFKIWRLIGLSCVH